MTRSFADHEELEALIAADALGGLDPEDQRRLAAAMAEHGSNCLECRRLLAAYSEAAAGLAMSVDPQPMSGEAESRLFAAIREAPQVPDRSQGLRVVSGRGGRRPAAGPTGSAQRWMVAAAAAAVALVAGSVGYALAPRAPEAHQQLVAFLTKPGTRVASFAPRDGQTLAVAFRGGAGRGWVIGSSVPAPPEDRVYQLWAQAPGSDEVQPAGTFVPSDGTVVAATPLPARFEALMVSVEPEGGSEQPTTKPLFVVKV